MKELDDFKATWQDSTSQNTSGTAIQGMTKAGKHPVLRRLRLKFFIQIAALTAFLLLYRDAFDGPEKPLYAQVALIVGAILFLFNDLLGVLFLIRPVHGAQLKDQLQNSLHRMRILARSSAICSSAFALGVLLFFTSVIAFDTAKYMILAGMVATFLFALFFSIRIWQKRIRRLQNSLRDFD